MAMRAVETPNWAISRANVHQPKHMDGSSLVPVEQLSPAEQSRMAGVWLAYYYTLRDPKRNYVYGAAVDLVKNHALNSTGSYSITDLGAGNGWNTFRTAQALHQIPSLTSHLTLVEQSGTALSNAYDYFERNGFPVRFKESNSPALSDFEGNTARFLQGDVLKTNLPDQSQDAVTMVNVWHHLRDWSSLIASADEMDRILKPGGIFVVIDTRPLPESGLMKHIIGGSIRKVVNPEKFLDKALKEGVKLDEDMVKGIEDFCRDDALRAFDNALTRNQFQQVVRESALAPSLRKFVDLRSPHPFLRLIYPPLNMAYGIKVESPIFPKAA